VIVIGLTMERNSMEIVGLAVGGLSLILTFAIYFRQKKDQDTFERALQARIDSHRSENKSQFDETQSNIAALARAVSSNITRDDEEAVLPSSEAAVGVEVIPGVDRFAATEIPLQVLSDLVEGWRQIDDGVDRRGWTIADVHFAMHKRAGKGNHPWFVFLRDSEDFQNTSAWRITRGGRGRTGPTVTYWEPENESASSK
jgi:hypothetical protein